MLPMAEAIRSSCTRWERIDSRRDLREQDRQEPDRAPEGRALLRAREPAPHPRARGRQVLLRAREEWEPDRAPEGRRQLRARDLREAARAREQQEPVRIRDLLREAVRGARARVRVRDLRGQLRRDLRALLRVAQQRDRAPEGEVLLRDPRGTGDLSSLLREFSRRISWKRMMNSNLNF